MKKFLAGLLTAVMLVSAAGCSSGTQATSAASEQTSQADEQQTETSQGGGLYQPGTYTAQTKGFGGTVTVTITVKENEITDVSAEGAEETDGFGSRAIEQLPGEILAAQGVEVDTVSGCTVTSNAVLDAAAAALNEAMGNGETSAVSMAPGTYTAEEYGFQQIQPVTVSVTVDENSIQEITIDDSKESVAMVRSVETYLIPRILEQQSISIDAITGATATSNAVLSAVRNALAQALEAGGSDASAITVFQKPEEKVDEGKTETIEVDVLVVGLGAAGTAACLSTAEAQTAAGQEVSVLGIDRAGRWGGTGAFTGSIMAVNAPEFKEEFNDGEDYQKLG